jgi:protein phosphatase 2C
MSFQTRRSKDLDNHQPSKNQKNDYINDEKNDEKMTKKKTMASRSIRNKREYMEDTSVVASFKAMKAYKMLAVFDGHNGADIARLCKERAPGAFLARMKAADGDVESALRGMYADLDDLALAAGKPEVGCTACIVVIGPDRVWFSNAGDSLSIALLRAAAVMTSVEHKVKNERRRIEESGGIVTCWDGTERIYGTLNLSRSIGDHYLKEFVLHEPHVESIARSELAGLVLASDGVWDVLDKDDVRDLVLTTRHSSHPVLTHPQQVCDRIIRAAVKNGSTDNITCIYADLANDEGGGECTNN